jgi:hypothetical protein
MKKLFIIFLVFVISILSATAQVEMADKLREDGKIYAVLAVILIIFAGIITYMFVLDRKISKLEDKK